MTQDLSNKDIEKITQNLESSLDSTIKGLEIFVDSFEKSGLKKAIPEYKKLLLVLTQQRLWCTTNSVNDLQSFWDSIATQANILHHTLNEFSNIMKDLKNINHLSHEPTKRPESEKILDELRKPQFVSLSKLTVILNEDRKKIKEIMDPLIKSNTVEIRNLGNTIQYRLVCKTDNSE